MGRCLETQSDEKKFRLEALNYCFKSNLLCCRHRADECREPKTSFILHRCAHFARIVNKNSFFSFLLITLYRRSVNGVVRPTKISSVWRERMRKLGHAMCWSRKAAKHDSFGFDSRSLCRATVTPARMSIRWRSSKSKLKKKYEIKVIREKPRRDIF